MKGADVPRLLLDEPVAFPVVEALRDRDVDAVHALEADLGGRSDAALLRWCRERDRILLTRNYKDFVPLVVTLRRRQEDIPGVLFFSSGIPWSDVDAHLRSVRAWLRGRRGG